MSDFEGEIIKTIKYYLKSFVFHDGSLSLISIGWVLSPILGSQRKPCGDSQAPAGQRGQYGSGY